MTESEPRTAGETKAQPCAGDIHILPDDPAKHDQLGSHGALAAAIAHLVGNEPGGKAIALEGAWGSGKSTVVRLLKAKLENVGTGRVFVFDSWAHEGDPLRRSLVEEFRTWVNEQNLVPEKSAEEWKRLEKEVDKLARRLTELEVESKITLSLWGRLMVVLLALVPVGAILASEFHAWHSWVSIAIVLAPALLLAILLLFAAGRRGWTRWKHRKAGITLEHAPSKQTDNTWHAFDAALGIFLRQLEKKTWTKGQSTPDPTSIEFAGTFEELLKNVLHWMANQKLLIVLDNLDRLPGREAIRAFATLRALLDKAHDTSEALGRLWLLVPYDPRALHGSPTAATVATPISPIPQTPFIAPGVGAPTLDETEMAFRDKLFQARFRVPQPVLIRWQDYLKSCLTQSLPAHKAPEVLADIGNLFMLVRDHGPGASLNGPDVARYTFPTPREIKLFVNRLAALHMQWPCELAPMGTNAGRTQPQENQTEPDRIQPIPIIIQAAFALCENRVESPGNHGQTDLSEFVPGSGQKHFLQDPELRLIEKALAPLPAKTHAQIGTAQPRLEWERHVAAMWYGVPQNEALHMLLRPPISRRLLYAESPDEQILASRNIPGFWPVARAVAREFLGSPDAGALFRCARVLVELANWRNKSNEWKEAWKNTQEDAINTLSQLESAVDNNLSPPTGQDLAKAIQSPETEPQFGRAVLQVLTRIPPGPADGFFQTWANVTTFAMDAMSAQGWERDLSLFRLPHSPIAFVALLSAAQKFANLANPAAKWQAPGGPETVIAFLRGQLQSRNISAEGASALAWLSELHPDWPWEPSIEFLIAAATEANLNPAIRWQLVRALRTQLERPGPSLIRGEPRQQVKTRIGSNIPSIIQSRQQQLERAPTEEKAQIKAEIEELNRIQQILSGR